MIQNKYADYNILKTNKKSSKNIKLKSNVGTQSTQKLLSVRIQGGEKPECQL